MLERRFSAGTGYRYGFNGKENDSETATQDYGMRIYNPRIGRFLSVDPLSGKFPMLTPYQFASNRPIEGTDLDGLEFLSAHSSMYRLEYNVMRSDIRMGNGTVQTVTTSKTVVNVVYENIPSALQDEKTGSFTFVNGGYATSKGRDFDPRLDGDYVYPRAKFYSNSVPGFNGLPPGAAPEPTDATKPVLKKYGDETPVGSYGRSFKGGQSVEVTKEAVEIGVNQSNTKVWYALCDEGKLRKAFYNATRTVDLYLKTDPSTGANFLGNELSGESDRADLINFVTDGYLNTASTDRLTGSEFTDMRSRQYGHQLKVATLGLGIMRDQPGILVRQSTIKSVRELISKYKQAGGGNEYDKVLTNKAEPSK